jgi:hypothetical protein
LTKPIGKIGLPHSDLRIARSIRRSGMTHIKATRT